MEGWQHIELKGANVITNATCLLHYTNVVLATDSLQATGLDVLSNGNSSCVAAVSLA